MPRTTKTNYAKVTVWGADGVRMEASGGPIGVLDLAFMSLARERREKALATFQATHQRMLEREAQRVLEAAAP